MKNYLLVLVRQEDFTKAKKTVARVQIALLESSLRRSVVASMADEPTTT
jgi:hypothetical protein